MTSSTLLSSQRKAILQIIILFSHVRTHEVIAVYLEEDKSKSMTWFKTNQMAVNTSNFYGMFFA